MEIPLKTKESIRGALNLKGNQLSAGELSGGVAKPAERAGSTGRENRLNAGRREAVLIVFLNMEELRVYGEVAIREYLKHRPPRPKGVRTGQVVEFVLGGHQIALSSEGES
jgi:hypothetical protein